MTPDRLKLRAHDLADLAVLSAALQDALVAVGDMAWLPQEHRFVLVANRFRWEAEPETLAAGELEETTPTADGPAEDAPTEDAGFAAASANFFSRANCGLCFDRVLSAKTRGFDPRKRDQLLNLLAIKSDGRVVRLYFSDGAEVRLEVARIAVHLEDLGESWPTHWRPSHTLDDSGKDG